MDLMLAEWDETERFSFEDSDRFEEDSLCSWISEPESLCQNWRGWKRQSAGPNSPTIRLKGFVCYPAGYPYPYIVLARKPDGRVGLVANNPTMKQNLIPDEYDRVSTIANLRKHGIPLKYRQVSPLVELAARQVALYIPFEVVEKVYPPVPEQLQLRIAFWSFPENEEDIRLYSCLANGSADEFARGEHLLKNRVVKDPLQIAIAKLHRLLHNGQVNDFTRFHLSATVIPPQNIYQSKGAYNVAVMFDRCRVTSCSCTCGAGAKWCSHVVALCLFRIQNAAMVCLRAPVSESLSRLQRDQLQKFAQYLISELPQQILPTAQRLLDELLSSQSTAINTMCGAPDPTAGPSASDQSTWYLDEDTLSENIKKTLHKFCGPSPIVFSDVNSLYLSSTEPPAAAEWACLLRPLRGREPEGIWNLLSIVREMFRRRDTNAVLLLEILTDLCLACEQIAAWWYNVRTSPSHSSASGHATRHSGGGGGGQSEVAAHACASMCDEIVALWRLAVLDPAINAPRSSEIVARLRQWHLRVLEVARRGQSRKNLGRLFLGFKPAIEACFIDWGQACPIPGITNCSNPVGGAPDKRLGCGRPSSVGHVTVPSRKTRPGDSCLKTKEECGRRKPGVVVTDGSGHGGRIEEKGVGAAKSGSLTWGVKQGSGGTKAGAGGTRGSSRVRLSSEEEVDSSLEPDMADLRLEEGGLALGAEASNAFCVEPGTLHKGQMELDVPAAKGLWAKGSSLDGEAVDPAESLPTPSNSPCGDLEDTEVGCQGDDVNVIAPAMEVCHEKSPENGCPSMASGGGKQDDYSVYYYISAESVKEQERPPESPEEKEDVFAGLRPLNQESHMEVLFACAEALHSHGHAVEACRLAIDLARELLQNPPDLKVEIPPNKGKKVKVSTHKQTLQATGILAKAAFLITVLSERPEHHGLAFVVGLFALELQRPPASTKALEVRLAYQESEIVFLLKKIPLGPAEMAVIRERAAQLREGCFCDYRPVLPLMLASFIFDVLCSPVVSSTGSRPPSRNRTSQQPGDEELGFEAAITALGLKTTVSEAEHPLLCEGTRRQKGELALALLITYKDDQVKLKKILDKLLDRESQTHKPQTLSSFYSSSGKPPNQKSPSKHASHSSTTTAAVPSSSSAPHASCVSGGLSLPLANTQNTEGFSEDLVTAGCPQHGSADGAMETSAYKQDGKVSGRLVFGSRGFFNGRSWGSPIRPKKKHTGMASIDSSAPETTSDSSPTLSRRPLPPRGGWGCGSWGRGQDSDSISSSSSDSLGSSSSSGSLSTTGPRGKGTEGARYKGRRAECHAPHVPNQPSEAAAHFYFELAKTVLVKAGGNSSTSLFTHPAASGGHQGPHRNLHLSAFEIGLYALGLHNFVSPNWLSRTYSSHVSWITGQAMEIGSAALNILVDCWDGHLTPPEVASLADRASRARDANMVRAAAELALSCLPHAHALNPNEIQRALLQCKEQDSQMLEKACIAVEEAAKGGGVYPEVLFDVAHQWHWLFEQTLGGSSGGGGGGGGSESRPQSNHSEAGHIEHDAVLGPTAVHARLPGNSPNCSRAQSVVSVSCSIANPPAYPPGAGMVARSGPIAFPAARAYRALPGMSHPHVTTVYTAGAYGGVPHRRAVQHVTAIFPQPPVPEGYPQGIHPAFLPTQYQYPSTGVPHTALPPPPIAVPLQPVPPGALHQPFAADHGLPLTPVAFVGLQPATSFQLLPSPTLQAISAAPPVSSTVTAVPPSVSPEDGSPSHPQPVTPQGLHYLLSAYRVGMLALEMLGRRAHSDHPNNIFSRTPPYTEDVKWLLGLAVKLGISHVQQFCMGAAKGLLSPFVLQELIVEALQFLSRTNPTGLHSHLRSPALSQLIQRCQQTFRQCIEHRLYHISPVDYDDFVGLICCARTAFFLTPVGVGQFNEVLQGLRRSKYCKKELYQRIFAEMPTYTA